MSHSTDDPSPGMTNSPNSPLESDDAPSASLPVGDDMLPPVDPPTGRFVLQLFVIPAAIVVAILGSCTVIQQVVLKPAARPDELIRGLYGSPEKRWQSAQRLADVLRDDKHIHVKQSEATARQLADIIDKELAGAQRTSLTGQDVSLLMFVCRALGEFHTDVGMPALLRAANFKRSQDALDVRRWAIQAIAVLTATMRQQPTGKGAPQWDGSEFQLTENLIQLSNSQQKLVRSETTLALLAMESEAAREQLAKMLDDPYPDARYNAANALARLGDLRAAEVVAEMIDPEENVALKTEDPRPLYRKHKRKTILLNALESAKRLAKAHPDADLDELIEVTEALADADEKTLQEAYIEPWLISEVEQTLKFLKEGR